MLLEHTKKLRKLDLSFLLPRRQNLGESMDIFEASQLITDKYSVRILVGTTKKPKSAIELSEKFGIPIAACYRKIRELERSGL